MHHGTILYDSDLSILSLALKPPDDKIESKGIKSIKSRVTNIRPYMKTDMPISEFWSALKNYMIAAFEMSELNLTADQNAEVENLKEKVYTQWNWNYGNSPPHTVRKTRRVEGCGKIDIFLDIEHEGIIKNIAFYGDFFGNRDLSELVEKLVKCRLEYSELKAALNSTDISRYFYALNTGDFIALLLS